MNVNIELLKQILDKQLESFSKVSGADIMLSPISGKTLNEASIMAKNMNDEYVSIEHLLLAIFKSKSKIAQILKKKNQYVTKQLKRAQHKKTRQ